jgi:hypothetical protein
MAIDRHSDKALGVIGLERALILDRDFSGSGFAGDQGDPRILRDEVDTVIPGELSDLRGQGVML